MNSADIFYPQKIFFILKTVRLGNSIKKAKNTRKLVTSSDIIAKIYNIIEHNG